MSESIRSDDGVERKGKDKQVIAACKKVMFHKYHGSDSESDSEFEADRVIIRPSVRVDNVDAEELTSERPENVDHSLTQTLLKSSGVQGSWTKLKQNSENDNQSRRKSLWLGGQTAEAVPEQPTRVLRRKRSRKGLNNVINSIVNNLKLGKRYEDKVKVGEMYLTQRQLSILSTAFSIPKRDERIHELKSNIANIDEKMQQLNSQRATRSPTNRSRCVTDDRLSLPNIELNENVIRFEEEGQTQEYFRRWVRVVMIVLRWISVILQISENKRSLDRELKSFTDIATEIERQSQKSRDRFVRGPTFDKNQFVTNKEITLSFDVRRTLTLRSYARSPTMLQQVMHGLQTLQSLAEYPLHIQEKLCKVAWYQQIEPKRAILRQGHFAEFFYFILSGQAFVKKMVENEKTKEPEMRTVARLSKGQSFGEVALLYRTTRTATVESATAMELLMVSGEDFIRIFTRSGRPDEEPAYVTFLREIPVFETWPVDKIKLDPATCFMHYFKRGSVVTPDSDKSEWIFIVKAGCCEVLQQLDAAKPRSAKELNRIRRVGDKQPFLPRQNVPNIVARVEDGCSKSRRKVPIPSELFDVMKQYFDGIREAAAAAREAERQRLAAEKARIEAEERKKAMQQELPDWKNFKKNMRKVTFPGDVGKEEKGEQTTSGKLPKIGGSKNNAWCTRLPLSPSGKHIQSTEEADLRVTAPTESDLLEMYRPVSAGEKLPTKPGYTIRNGSVYVTIEILHAKGVFGLNTLNFNGESFEKTSPVCLISRGAEIIMLSKKLFIKYADEQTRHLVKEQVKRYPGQKVMQMNLQSEVDWDLYKNTAVTGFLDKTRYQKTLLPTV